METNSKEEKRMRLFELIDHPETFTDEEISALLSDDDIRKSYEALAAAKHAIAEDNTVSEEANVDVDKEWERFSASHHNRNLLKTAASIIGIILISGVAFALAVRFNATPMPQNKEKQNKDEIVSNTKGTSTNVVVNDTFKAEKNDSVASVTFEDVPLGDILNELAKYYDTSVNVNNEAMLAVRLYFVWNKNKSIEENIQLLNGFDRIRLKIDGNVIKSEE